MGGHLVFHAAVGITERIAGVLSVDPLGAVGDGGGEAFGAEMLARVPEASRDRARALDERDTAGESTPEEAREALSLFWGRTSPILLLLRRCRTWSSPSRPTRGCGRI